MMKKLIFLLSYFVTQVFADTLFICAGNTGRSYMAEVLANKMLYHDSFSRGLDVHSTTPEENATIALFQWNLEQTHVPQQLQNQDIQNAELVLTMTEQQKKTLISRFPVYTNKIYTLSECATGAIKDIEDPHGKDLEFYQAIRNQIFEYEDMIASRGWSCKK
jgi:protein-tyrosine-phosphatase